MWNLKKNSTNYVIHKTEIVTDVENTVTGGERVGGINLEIGIVIHILFYIK